MIPSIDEDWNKVVVQIQVTEVCNFIHFYSNTSQR